MAGFFRIQNLAATSFFVVVSLAIAQNDEQLTRTEEKLTTDRDFYDQWMKLINVQAEQLEEQSLDYPLDYVIRDLAQCPETKIQPGLDTNAVQPQDIAIYAEMGQLSSYCPSNHTLLSAGILGSCKQRSHTMKLPSLPKMLQIRGADLKTIDANHLEDPLPDQAKSIADEITRIPGYEEMWKMIVITATIQDGTASETGQTAIEVLAAIQELGQLLPKKTFVVVLRTSGSGLWRDASHANEACRTQLSKWKVHNKFNYNSVWDQVEIIVQKNYLRPNFSVEILPLFRDAALNNLPNMADLSVLGYDCAHFSERGLSLLHLAMWNALVTRAPSRLAQYRPSTDPILCPDPKCPFLRTAANSDLCVFAPLDESYISMMSHVIVIVVLVITIILACLILFCVCNSRRVSHVSKTPAKAFGASFSSIKFIDEDVI